MASNEAIYSATYSNVPVYEFNVEGNHVMRRRQDDWINATHILKVADYDKPARTRILEREVQKGVHEKVQGGYGKYQGTWIPLSEGRLLAERNGVLAKLLPIFDFRPGPVSPPQAPKHHTAASTKELKQGPPMSQISEDQYDNISAQLNDDDSIENSTVASASYMDEDDVLYRQKTGSRKRKRGPEVNFYEQQHTLYADSLLDYFMLSSEAGEPYRLDPPQPPEGFQINRAIDDQEHTGLHWGAAMGDIEIIRMFISLGANIHVPNVRGETPLIRAVLFTNNYEKETMPKLTSILQGSINDTDKFRATVFHHIAMTTKSSSRKKCARYYFQVLLNKLSDISTPYEMSKLLNSQDNHGDTALHIVARHGARKCVRLLIGAGAGGDILNRNDESANQIMQRQISQRHEKFGPASSSPLAPPPPVLVNGTSAADASQTTEKPLALANSSCYTTQSAQSFSTAFGPMVLDKGLQISLALENEIQEKDADLAEAIRLGEIADAERDAVRQATLKLMVENSTEHESEEDTGFVAVQAEQWRAQNESFLEQEQHRNLHQEIRAREEDLARRNAGQMMNGVDGDGSGGGRNDGEKLEVAHALVREQERRRELSRMVVEAQADAGMGERGEAYRRLVAGSVGVQEEDVAAMVPELLEELEMSRAEGVGLGRMGAGAGIVSGRVLAV
ncbi:MAG: hypothetical protein Q9190_000095 [Brigantiaea leucoxantha]